MKKILLTLTCLGLLSFDVNANDSQICLNIDPELKIDTTNCYKRLAKWKVGEDKSYLKCYAMGSLIPEDFLTKDDVDFIEKIHEEQNIFFDNSLKILTTPYSLRTVEWYNDYLNNICLINDVIAGKGIESFLKSFENKLFISQEIFQSEKMLEQGDMTTLDFCKRCWIIYRDSKVDEILNFIEKYDSDLSDEEYSELEYFIEQNSIRN